MTPARTAIGPADHPASDLATVPMTYAHFCLRIAAPRMRVPGAQKYGSAIDWNIPFTSEAFSPAYRRHAADNSRTSDAAADEDSVDPEAVQPMIQPIL